MAAVNEPGAILKNEKTLGTRLAQDFVILCETDYVLFLVAERQANPSVSLDRIRGEMVSECC